MLQAYFTALGTSSSGAALPISIDSMETRMKIDKRITRFILPLGNTINLDGNALYEAVAVIFIAQMNNMHLSLAQVVTISITTTLASMGTGSVPIGLLPVLLVLSSIGLPASDVTFLFTVDWLIPKFRAACDKQRPTRCHSYSLSCKCRKHGTTEIYFSLCRNDRIRTAINVMGDGFTTAIVWHYLGDQLTDAENEKTEECLVNKNEATDRNNLLFHDPSELESNGKNIYP